MHLPAGCLSKYRTPRHPGRTNPRTSPRGPSRLRGRYWVHLLLVGGLRAIVSPDKAIGYDIVIDPVENLLFEDAASLIQGDAIGSQPLVFVEDVGIKT